MAAHVIVMLLLLQSSKEIVLRRETFKMIIIKLSLNRISLLNEGQRLVIECPYYNKWQSISLFLFHHHSYH